ncbi:uncharacterized protein LOC105187944 isoform X3 [Harpegnathos saltator]|uniref:uncharacterized protein LOC105187944 isoform X3 n=1 Tax=Harpegnathos saltator TaxID=610380 RepID=UPI000DBEDFE1|nr:uncharacterized protein LOC105187944 isoform X3 [Harpegnathos saltator]
MWKAILLCAFLRLAATKKATFYNYKVFMAYANHGEASESIAPPRRVHRWAVVKANKSRRSFLDIKVRSISYKTD